MMQVAPSRSRTEFSAFSENAIKPLIREQDPEIQQKLISLVESAGKEVIEFKKNRTDLSVFNQKTIMPLIREQDPEIQQKLISLVESAGKEKVMNYGTERKMMQTYILTDGKRFYCGKTVNLERRLKEHIKNLEKQTYPKSRNLRNYRALKCSQEREKKIKLDKAEMEKQSAYFHGFVVKSGIF